MNIDDLTIGQAREIAAMFSQNRISSKDEPTPLPVGKNVLIRTVTHYYTGKLIAVGSVFLTLDDAAWIADTGRFSDALASGVMGEVEPFTPGRRFVSIGAIVDIGEWVGTLPLVKK